MSPGDHLVRRDLREWLPTLAAAGLRAVSLREPHLTADQLRDLAAVAVDVGLKAWLHIRNPHALALGGLLHLPAGAARPAPPGVPFGQSCHDGTELDAAFAAGARWALLSPVWAPRSKPGDRRRPLGLQAFAALAGGRPVLALGGVDAARYREVAAVGHGVAVCGALFEAPDPAAAARELRGWFQQSGQENWNSRSS